MRCIACEELELARVRDQRPSQTLPLPAAALAGLPEGRDSRSLTRRSLLKGGVAGAAAIYGTRALGFEEVFEAAVAEAAGTVPKAVVLLYLAGGNDGLNVMLPGPGLGADYAAYAAQRPTIARLHGDDANGRVGSRTLGGTDDTMALANVLTAAGNGSGGAHGFDTLYGNGSGDAGSQLALIPACDYTPASLSHFDSSDYWFAGALQGLTTGWLGRWIDRNGSASNPLQAVSIDYALSKAIRTSVNPVCALPSADGLGFPIGDYWWNLTQSDGLRDVNSQIAALSALPAGADNAYLRRARSVYGQTIDVADSGTTISNQAETGVAYPENSGLANDLKLAARVLGAKLGTRVITVHWGGFDTHGTQVQDQDPQLKELSWALSAFKADLATRGIEDRVVTVAFSEFGRRVEENGSQGTDHGAGGLMMLSGSQVKGGLVGAFPGCRPGDLDGDGNLKVATDFRSVFSSVLGEWLGGELSGVLPGGSFPALVRHGGGSALFR